MQVCKTKKNLRKIKFKPCREKMKEKPLKYVQQLQSRDTRAIPVKSAANNNRRTMVHT